MPLPRLPLRLTRLARAKIRRHRHPQRSLGHLLLGAHLRHLRFLSDAVIEFQREQVDILRAAQPSWWITHNGLFDHIDYPKLAADLDFLSVDIYPGFAEQPADFVWAATMTECARAASGTFIVPEQQAGAGGQRPYVLPTTAPGQMRLWTYQSIAHGAAGILHFRWRTCPFGAEMYWNGILDHDDIPRRRYDEFAQEGRELARLAPRILGTIAHVRAAVLLDHDQDEAHTTLPLGLPRPKDQRSLIYGEMLHRHLPAGFVSAADSFAGLDLIVLSGFALMDEHLAARLRAFVESGGTLVATARTATRDRRNHVIRTTPPGLLADLLGTTVEEFGKLSHPLLDLRTNSTSIPLAGGYEILTPTTATPLATWTDTTDSSPHAAPGTPAITRNHLGRGTAIAIGTWFSAANVTPLFDLILSETSIPPLAEADPLVEITRRVADDRELTFLLNHQPTPRTVTGLPTGHDILADEPCPGTIVLPASGVAIIESAPAPT
jgi:beta-galactosidase